MKQVKSILEFDDGSILNQAQAELHKALENIADINTSTKPREITIKLKLIPDEKRRHIEMVASVTSKLQPSHAIATSMQMSMSENGIEAVELSAHPDGQVDIFGEIHEAKCIKFEKKKEVM